MLVLSRKVGEKIIINDNITVTVVAVEGHRVRLGFTAPSDVCIMRSEVLDRANASRRWAAPAAKEEADLALSH